MGAKTGAVGPGVTCVGRTFVQHFEGGGGQPLSKDLVHLLGNGKGGHGGLHGSGSGLVALEVRRNVDALADQEHKREGVAP